MPIIRLGRITETPVPRAATTSTKSAPRVLRPKRRCAGAFRIIKAATRRGTHEPAGPGCLGDATGAGCCAGERAGMRFLEFFAANNRVSLPVEPEAARHLSDVAAAVGRAHRV